MLSHEQAAKTMGMAVREIVAVAQVGDDHVVTTHDGVHTLVDQDGRTSRYTGPLPTGDEPAPDRGEGEGEGPGGEQAAAADVVAAGTVEQVLAWVGDDRDRAQRALDAEQARSKPRAGLTAALAKIGEQQ